MTESAFFTDELRTLVDMACNGVLTEQDATQLEQLLQGNDEAQHFYLGRVSLDTLLQWEIGNQTTEPKPSSLSSPILGVFQTNLHSTFGYISSGWPMAYLVATAMTAIGLLVCGHTYITRPNQMVGTAAVQRPSDSRLSTRTPSPSVVARITGMVDCVWSLATKNNLPSPARGRGAGGEGGLNKSNASHSPVSLGDRFSISSGLLEITYDTGAKVLLQGPVTYEVDSATGGYLAVGKLTARLEKDKNKLPSPACGRGVGGEGGLNQSNDHQSSVSLFAVRTPSAVVTDLGTEFGVEVDAQKGCYTETFVGLVSVSPTNAGKSHKSWPVAAGESIRVDAGGTIAKHSTTKPHFVRHIHSGELTPYTKVVLQDRPWVYWPLDELPGAHWVSNRAGSGSDGRVVGVVRLGQDGPFRSDRNFAAEFTGHGYIETNQLPNNEFSQGFTAEFWARVDGGIGQGLYRSPITFRDCKDVHDQVGFTFYAMHNDTWAFVTGTGQSWENLIGGTVVAGRWVYIAAAFEPTGKSPSGALRGVRKLYVDGNLAATDEQTFVPNLNVPLRIGAGATESPSPDFSFLGRIAHVAIYNRPLVESQIKTHWNASKLTGPAGEAARKEDISK